MSDNNSTFAVRGRTFFNKPFFNNILSTNISLYKYLADQFFDGDMGRVVWASTDMMFRRRQEQLADRKQNNSPKDNLNVLDMPFCSFRITQDGIRPGTERNWWNASLAVKGMWFEKLGRRLTLLPATINYEACFCCNHDTDLYWMQQEQIWDKGLETILESFVDATANDGSVHTLKNIIIHDVEPHVNQQFSEREWLEKNKIQTVTMDISCQTWLIAEDEHHRYSVTKNVIFDFLVGARYFDPLEEEATPEEQEQLVRDLFLGNGASKLPDRLDPKKLKPKNSLEQQLALNF